MSDDTRPVTSEDWKEFIAFLARDKGMATEPREGETVETMKERIQRDLYALLRIDVEFTEENGTWTVWNTTDLLCHDILDEDE